MEDGFGLGDLVTLVRRVISGGEVQVDIVASVPLNIGGVTPVVAIATGVGAIIETCAPGIAFWLDSITCHFSAAPTTAEDFVVTLDALAGTAYDTVLARVDPSTLTDGANIVYRPDDGLLLCEAGDAIDVAYTNTDGNTYGLRICVRAA